MRYRFQTFCIGPDGSAGDPDFRSWGFAGKIHGWAGPEPNNDTVGLAQSTEKNALGGYQLFEQVESGHQSPIQLASLGNFDWSTKTASDYANATNRIFISSKADFDSKFPESSFPATKDHTSAELQESAWKVYQDTSQGTKPIVMGRLDDTAAGADLGFQRLSTDKRSLEVNDRWVQGGIDAKRNFYLGSPETPNYLWDAANNRPTVMAREIQPLKNAGYVKQGDYYVQPSKLRETKSVHSKCSEILQSDFF